MNIDEKEKLFIDIDGPRLQAAMYIYALQSIDNGIKFALANCNNRKARIAEIIKTEEGYSIKYIWYKKPGNKDYMNYPLRGLNLQKKTVRELNGLNIQELREEIKGAFPW